MIKRFFALAALALLTVPTAAPAAVFECSIALDSTVDAMNAISRKAVGMNDKAQRCRIRVGLLPLADRQVTIAEVCEAYDSAKLTAAQHSASQTRADYLNDCGSLTVPAPEPHLPPPA